jgi:hypothetical protein
MNRVALLGLAGYLGLAACTTAGRDNMSDPNPTARSLARAVMTVDPESRCSRSATATVNGKPRRVRIEVTPCRVGFGEAARAVLTNIGETEVGYGPGFKLERKTDDRWRWINRRQAFTLPLFYLSPGERGEPEALAVYFDSPKPVELNTGLYRITKTVQLTPGKPRPPTMKVRVNFRIVP